jgi:hypothetical protein
MAWNTERHLTCASFLLAAVALAAPLRVAANVGDARQLIWLEQASTDLDPQAAAALRQITGTDRRLLAVRAYLRAGATLPRRWSWTQQQIAAYPQTPEGVAAAADIDAVLAAFAAENPGFTLRVNRLPRSLELQIAHWNDNRSVGRTAAALVSALQRQFDPAAATPDGPAVRNALINWTPATAATLAAPGLSAHGQARAYDFQIERDGRVIAGIESASAQRQWDMAGWTGKLRAAVRSAGDRFSGPLAAPYEPWHYAYSPN